MRQTITLLREVKNSGETEVGRAQGYIFVFFAGAIFTLFDLLAFIPSLIFYNKYIFLGLLIHLFLSITMTKNAVKASTENIKLLVKRSPKLMQALQERDQQKFESFLKESEETPSGHRELRLLLIVLIVGYIAAFVYMFTSFRGITFTR